MVGPIGKKYKEALKGSESAQLSFTEGIFSSQRDRNKKCSIRPNFIHIQLVEAGPLSYLTA